MSSSTKNAAPASPENQNLAVNLEGVQAGTNIVKLEIILEHTIDTRQFTTCESTNATVFDYLMEGLACRLADIVNDVILKFTLTALRHIDLDSATGTQVCSRLGILRNDTGRVAEEKILQIESALSYNLSKLRVIANELGFPLRNGPEGLILLRNSLIHRDGAYDEDMLRELASIFPDPSSLCGKERIEVSSEFIKVAIKKCRDFIRDSESILHEKYGVEWTMINANGATRIHRNNEWAYKERN